MRACVSVIGPPGTAHTLLRAAAGAKGCSSPSPLTGASSAAGARRQGACRGALRPTPKPLSRWARHRGKRRDQLSSEADLAHPPGGGECRPRRRLNRVRQTPKRRNDLTHSGQKARWPAVGASNLLPAALCCTRIAVPCMLILLGGEQMTTAD